MHNNGIFDQALSDAEDDDISDLLELRLPEGSRPSSPLGHITDDTSRISVSLPPTSEDIANKTSSQDIAKTSIRL